FAVGRAVDAIDLAAQPDPRNFYLGHVYLELVRHSPSLPSELGVRVQEAAHVCAYRAQIVIGVHIESGFSPLPGGGQLLIEKAEQIYQIVLGPGFVRGRTALLLLRPEER